jgi:hypothetical protein
VHLTDSEFVEHVEGVLRPERVAHVQTCNACRRQVERLTAALADARAVDVPEPSPLFWDHFSAQVRAAVDEQQPSRASDVLNALRRPGLALAGAAMLALLVIAAVWFRNPRPVSDSAATTPAPASVPEPDLASLEADREWTFVATMADGIDWETVDAAGLSLRPGTVERMAEDLSREEQAELARLLREELGDGSL